MVDGWQLIVVGEKSLILLITNHQPSTNNYQLNKMLDNQTFLITGIADENSLAMKTAEKILANNGKVVCTGLGVTPFHKNLS